MLLPRHYAIDSLILLAQGLFLTCGCGTRPTVQRADRIGADQASCIRAWVASFTGMVSVKFPAVTV